MGLDDLVSRAIPKIIKECLNDNLPDKTAEILSNHAQVAAVSAMLGG